MRPMFCSIQNLLAGKRFITIFLLNLLIVVNCCRKRCLILIWYIFVFSLVQLKNGGNDKTIYFYFFISIVIIIKIFTGGILRRFFSTLTAIRLNVTLLVSKLKRSFQTLRACLAINDHHEQSSWLTVVYLYAEQMKNYLSAD